MKKWLSIVAVMLAVVCCLTGCNLTSQLSGIMGGEAEATEKVESMMAALAENRLKDATALMHSDVEANCSDAIAQMSEYLAGRSVASITQQNVQVNTSTGTAGKTRMENVTYAVELEDGTDIHVVVMYLSNRTDEGFTSFQIVLGVV